MMAIQKLKVLNVFVASLLVFGLIGCYPPGDSASNMALNEIPQNIQTSEIERQVESGDNTATVIFAAGTVERVREGSSDYLDIGDTVRGDDTIRVGADGMLELQIGDNATMMLEENTVAVMERLIQDSDTLRVQAQVQQGTVLAKVNGMREQDRFSVRTRSSVAGVRGTEFGVKALPDGTGRVVVGSGTVMVLPTDQNLEELWDTVEERDDATAERLLRQLEDSAQAVKAGEQLDVNPEVQQEVAQEIQQVVDFVRSEDRTEEQETIVLASVERVKQEVAEQVETRALEQEETQQMERLSRVQPVALSTQAQQLIPLVIRVVPEEAQISFNGEPAGRGRASKLIAPESQVRVSITCEGYETSEFLLSPQRGQDMQVEMTPVASQVEESEESALENVTEEAEEEIVEEIVEPEPFDPLVFHAAGLSAPAVRRGVVVGNRYILSDQTGKLYGFALDTGDLIWQVQTNNQRNENSQPVAAGNAVLFSGSSELVMVRASDGTIINRTALAADQSHLFGQNAVYSQVGILLPAENGIQLLDPSTLQVIQTFPVTGGCSMSPSLYNGNPVVVSAEGKLYVFDVNTGDALIETTTDAVQPLAQSVVVDGQLGFFGDRRGSVFAVNLSTGDSVWNETLTGSSGVFQDVVVGSGKVFVFSGSTVFALDRASGRLIYSVPGATGTPEIFGNQVMVPRGDELAIFAVNNGARVSSIDLPGSANTGVTLSQERVLLGMSDGSAVQLQLE
jgi:outer membrane protein assembly factor BamB